MVSKGLYRGLVDKSFPVEIKEYVFTRQNGKKFLLLRFLNESKNNITAMHFWLIQKDAHGNHLYKEKISLEGIYCGAGAMFTPNTCFPVQNKCVDFEVKMISAFSGDYEYKSENGEGYVRYTSVLEEKFSVRRNHYCVQRKKLNRKVKLLGLIVALAILIILGAIFFPLFINYVVPVLIPVIISIIKFIIRVIIIVIGYLWDALMWLLEYLGYLFEDMRTNS